jgi:hypothetical protein
MKKRHKARVWACSSAILLNLLLPNQGVKAADSILLTTMSSTCSGAFTIRSNVRYAFKFATPGAATVNTVNVLMSDAAQGSGTSAIFYADSSGTLSSVLGTLNWNSYNGTTKIAKFTGTANLPAAGNYWLEIYYAGGNIGPCYSTANTTTGSASGWSTFNQIAGAPSGSGFAYSGWWVMSMLSTAIDPPSISSPTLAAIATKGTSTPITISTNTAGQVQFFANKKRIPKCVAVPTSGTAPSLSATCNWIPSVQGAVSITAKLIVDSTTTVASGATFSLV